VKNSSSIGGAGIAATGTHAIPGVLSHRDRIWIAGILVGTVALSWAWIVAMARDMYGPMTGASAWMMTDNWDLPHLLLLFAMWVVMMAGMMLPSVAPALFTHARMVLAGPSNRGAMAKAGSFAGGYLVVWTGFSFAATAMQRVLAHLHLLSPMMEVRDARFGGLLFLIAGLYQFTPAKYACLRSCQLSSQFIALHRQNGMAGSFQLGFASGLRCVGCCWAVMLLLFVGGVMNLWWTVALTVFACMEKAGALDRRGARITGLCLVAAGIWYLRRGFA
jgi:predicted metal-binding membrane protein